MRASVDGWAPGASSGPTVAASVGCAAAGRPGSRGAHWSIVVGIDRVFFSGRAQYSWPPQPCVVQGIEARCGTFRVPENRAKPDGRTIGLHVVVLPARSGSPRKDAVAYLAGGPGNAATEQAIAQGWQSSVVNSLATSCSSTSAAPGDRSRTTADVTQYGTRTAMDDLDAVRAALGYRQLDVLGGSYGATAAQVYLRLHPSSVRTLILLRCRPRSTSPSLPATPSTPSAPSTSSRSSAPQSLACRKAFPHWERQFGDLVKAWNAHPVHGMTGDQFASVVHDMLRNVTAAVSIPLVVSRAAAGDYGPLERAGPGDLDVQPRPHGRVDLVQRALGRARHNWSLGHGLRQLHDGAHRGIPPGSAAPSRSAPNRARSGGSPRPAACRCSRSPAVPTRRIRSRTSPT